MSYVDFVVPSYLVKMNDMTEIPAYDQIGADIDSQAVVEDPEFAKVLDF